MPTVEQLIHELTLEVRALRNEVTTLIVRDEEQARYIAKMIAQVETNQKQISDLTTQMAVIQAKADGGMRAGAAAGAGLGAVAGYLTDVFAKLLGGH